MPKCTHKWLRVPHVGKNKFKCDWCELFGFCSENTHGKVVAHSKEVSEDLLEQYDELTARRMGKIAPARANPYAFPAPYQLPPGYTHED